VDGTLFSDTTFETGLRQLLNSPARPGSSKAVASESSIVSRSPRPCGNLHRTGLTGRPTPRGRSDLVRCRSGFL
jgi:hypothetical protein